MASNAKPVGWSTIQAQILAQFTEVKGKVDESLQQGRENGHELKMLRRELGLDSQHGRLPLVETTLVRLEERLDKSEARLGRLEARISEAKGKAKLIGAMLALLSGGAGGALIALLSHVLGLH